MAISEKANRLKQQMLLLQDRGLAPSTPLPRINPIQYLANQQPALSTMQSDPLGIDSNSPKTTGDTPTESSEPTPIAPSVWDERKAELSRWYSEQQAQYGAQRGLEEQRLGSDREVQVKNTDYYYNRLQKYLNDLNAVRGLSNSGIAESSQLQIGLNQANAQRGINADYQDRMSEVATRYGQWMTDLQKQYQDRGDYYTEQKVADDRYQDTKNKQDEGIKSANYQNVKKAIDEVLFYNTDYTGVPENETGYDKEAIDKALELLEQQKVNLTETDYNLIKKSITSANVIERPISKESNTYQKGDLLDMGNNTYYNTKTNEYILASEVGTDIVAGNVANLTKVQKEQMDAQRKGVELSNELGEVEKAKAPIGNYIYYDNRGWDNIKNAKLNNGNSQYTVDDLGKGWYKVVLNINNGQLFGYFKKEGEKYYKYNLTKAQEQIIRKYK